MKRNILLMISLFALLTGCPESGSSPQIEIVLPDGFRGIFVIKESPGSEMKIVSANDVYRVKIPANGVVEVADTSIFYRAHRSRAVYESGGAIPNEHLPSGRNSVLFFNLWSDTQRQIWFLIGTQDDRDKAQEKRPLTPGESTFD